MSLKQPAIVWYLDAILFVHPLGPPAGSPRSRKESFPPIPIRLIIAHEHKADSLLILRHRALWDFENTRRLSNALDCLA